MEHTDIIDNKYIIGDSEEQCLKDFLAYIQSVFFQGYTGEICLLEKKVEPNRSETLVKIIYNNHPAFKTKLDHCRDDERWKYDITFVDKISQEVIDDWCKASPNEISVCWWRDIYLISKRYMHHISITKAVHHERVQNQQVVLEYKKPTVLTFINRTISIY